MVDREDSASLPPADVQRPTPPLTDEELAAGTVPLPERPSIESLLQGTEFRPDLTDEELTQIAAHATEQGVVTCNDALMLLADLRASRERIRELEEDLKGKMTRQEWYEDYARW